MLKYQKKSSQAMKNNLQAFLYNMDLFGQAPVLRILKKNKFTTQTGFFCSLAISTICILYLVYQIKNLYDRQSPFVVFSEYQMTDTAPISLNMKNFTIAITVANMSMSTLTTLNTHFTITVKNCLRQRIIDEISGKTKISQNCTIYPTEACQDKHFVTDLQKEYFSTINLRYAQCLDYEMWKNNPPVLQGQVAGKTYQYLQIQVSECKNSTNFTGCASSKQILQELKNNFYALHLTDNLVQMKKPGNPFSEFISLQYTPISISNSKTLIQNFKQVNVVTDLGLVSQDNQLDQSLIQYTSQESQQTYNDQYLMLHYVQLDQRQAEYVRSYAKIQGILSTIGGLYQMLFLTICSLLRPIILKFMNLKMANKLFRFENSPTDIFDETQNPQQADYLVQSPKPSSTKRVLDFDIKKSNFSRSLQKSNLSKNIEKIKDSKSLSQYLKQRKQSLKLNLRDIIIMNLGCKKKEKLQIDYATDKFMSKLDVAYIISKIYEIDKLKLVLLNEDQLQLFNYLPKPVIPSVLFGDDAEKKVKEVEQNKAYKFILQDEKSDILKLQEAFKSFVKLSKKRDLNQIDQNILQILDEEILELFNSLNRDQSKIDQIFNQKLSINLQVSEPDYRRSHSIVDIDYSEDQPNNLPYLKSKP